MAQAASLRLAELQVESGQRAAVFPLYERALNGVTKPDDYRNTLVDLARVRQMLESGCRALQETKDFENAHKLALLHTRLAAAEPAQVLLGQVAEAWAHALLEPSPTTRTSETARTYFQEAANAYEAAAQASTALSARSAWLWHAGQDFLLGHDFAHAVSVLERFLKQNPRPPVEQQAEAWYRLGQAHQALGHTAVATASYKQCIAVGGPFAFRARYQLALAEIDSGHPTDAEESLRQNLELMHLEPDREAHEKSLYALADLLYRRRDHRMASQRWEQALTLYPTNPDASAARYRLADCYRHLADVEYQSLRPGEPFARSTHGHYRKQYILWLEMAGANYQKVIDDLEARQTAGRLTGAEANLLRQAQFALAACRFDGGNFDEAIRLYNQLARRYQSQVDGLKAARELYRCYVVPIPPDVTNARATLQRALIMLNSLEDSAFQGLPEIESRPAWEKWHKWAVDELRKLSP